MLQRRELGLMFVGVRDLAFDCGHWHEAPTGQRVGE